MRINNNLMAMNTHRQLGTANAGSAKSMEKLSSGYRINRAGDDAAGLAISEKMRGQIRGLNQASANSQDGISMIQTAEGALNETHAILQRMRELAVQSATDTNTNDDRSKIQGEVDQLASEITRISNTTEFNTRNLLAGGLDTTFHIGANEGQNVKTAVSAMDAKSLGVAGSTVGTTLTPGNGVISVSEASSDFGTGAIVSVTNVVAAAVTVNQGNTVGTIAEDAGNLYTGSESKIIEFTLSDVNGADGVVNKIKLADGTEITGTSGKFDLGDGVKIDIAAAFVTDATNPGTNQVGQKGSVTLKPRTVDIQLKNDAGDLGKAQTVNSSQSSITLGDASTGQTGKVDFTFADLAVADTAISQTIIDSTSATTDSMGNVSQKATVQKGINVSTQSTADKAITTINKALESVSAERSKLGAMQNRLEHTIKNLDTSSENLQASEARIRDVDMAKEMMAQTKHNILSQAATAMLAQANQAPQGVLQLLR